MKITFKKEGLEGDNLKLVQDLEKRFNELPEVPEKEALIKEVRSSMKDMINEDGKPKFDVGKLVEMLGEDDKGIRSMIKKQGEQILALKETTGGDSKKPKDIRSLLMDKKEDIQKLFDTRKGEVELNVRAAAIMTTGNVIAGSDYIPEDVIESFSVGAFVEKRQSREYVFDLASRRTTGEITKYKTWMEEGDTQGAFAIVAEGALKPLISMDLVRNFSEAKKVAAKYVVTEEFTKFFKEAYAIIQRLIKQKLIRDYAGLLTTDLLSDAAPYTASALDNQYPADQVTDYHAIAAVAAQIEALNFMPDLLIMNPQDKWRIGMLQAEDGHFFLTIPQVSPTGGTQMLGFSVRTSNKIPVGFFLLGESGLWEIEDEALTVRIGHGVTVTGGTSNGGGNVTDVQPDFDHNRLRVVVETYFHNYIASANQGSFVYGQFSVIKAILTI